MLGYLNAPSPFDSEGWLDTQDEVEGGSESDALERTILTFGLAVKPHPNVVLKADREQRSNKADTETGRWLLIAVYAACAAIRRRTSSSPCRRSP